MIGDCWGNGELTHLFLQLLGKWIEIQENHCINVKNGQLLHGIAQSQNPNFFHQLIKSQC